MSVTHGVDVLVVDDDEAGRTATRRIVERSGFTVITARDGAGALEAVHACHPRLVLLDVMLPDMTGFDVLRQIRADEALADLIVVLISAQRTQVADKTSGLHDGAAGYIVRPVDNDELVARVKAHLRNSHLVERVRASEKRLQRLISGMADGVVVLDEHGDVQFANPVAEALLGADSSGMTGWSFSHLLGQPRDTEVELRRADGRQLVVELRTTELEWDERPATIVSMRDVTERRQVEEKLRQVHRLEAVGEMSGGIAHGFNNLLTVVLGSAELLADRFGHLDEVSSLTTSITTSADRGAEMTRQLLAFAGRQLLSPEPVSLRPLLTSFRSLLATSLGADYHIELCVEGDPAAVVDRSGLEQSLLALCLNARDAMSTGGKITITVAERDLRDPGTTSAGGPAPGAYVEITVSDDGIGIDPDDLDKAFQPFFSTKGGGSGLGLPMVYGFAHQSGGDISITSAPGEGTSVTLSLPRADMSARGDGAEPEPSAGGGEHVLLVEDEDPVRNVVRKFLQSSGYRVTDVADAPAALAVLESDAEIDLLLTDVVLGGAMSGRSLAEHAIANRSGLRTLLMTGYSAELLGDDGPSGRTHSVLRKPFRAAELASAVRHALDP